MRFLDDLKRRKVVRAALAYAAPVFVVLQAAGLLASATERPLVARATSSAAARCAPSHWTVVRHALPPCRPVR
jgi:hypothetical protein